MNAPRSFFVTPYPRTELAALEGALHALGADSFEPARVLPARKMLVDVLDEVAEVSVSARTIYRADFPAGVRGGRRALAKVRGVNKVRASLDFAPAGEDLPAAARPIPSASKPPKMRPDPASRSTQRKRWVRIVVSETAKIERAFAAIGIEPTWQSGTGEWPGGFWTLNARNALGGKAFCLRLFCRDPQEADRLVVAVPGTRREK